MGALFLRILDMSVSAGILAGAVILLRLLLRKAPKYIHCILWAMVALRLIIPTLPSSPVSLLPDGQPVSSIIAAESQDAPVFNVLPPAQQPQTPSAPQPETLEQTNWLDVLSVIWLAGIGIMAAYGMVSYGILRRRVAAAVREGEYWLCDRVSSPFILGVIRPRIYLPSGMSEAHRDSVLAHEKAHLCRKDHWWKPLGFVLLAVHWFNPVMWLGYVLLCRDIEAACDERVVKNMEPEQRKRYSEALLECAMPRRSVAACPLAFGEQSVKSRIRSVLSYKKPTVWIILAAVVAAIILGVCFLTDPVDHKDDSSTPSDHLNTATDATEPSEIFVMSMRIEYSDDYLRAFERNCFYATDMEGKFYRVYCDDMTGLREAQLVRVTYSAHSLNSLEYPNGYPDGGYTPGYEITALEVKDHSTGEFAEEMIIVETLPSCLAFETDCFYAYGGTGYLCRVYCSDMSELHEGQRIRVTYTEASRRDIDTPQPPGGWSPKYELTAVKVEPHQTVSMVYFMQEDVGRYWGAPDRDGARYYAVPVTAGERDILLKLEEGRGWHDTWLSSYLPSSHMAMNVVVGDTWNFFSLNDDSTIVKGRYYAILTQEERELIRTLKNRAYESEAAQEYFTDDYLVYQQKIQAQE